MTHKNPLPKQTEIKGVLPFLSFGFIGISYTLWNKVNKESCVDIVAM